MLHIQTVPQTNSNRRIFRAVARASTGDTFEPDQSDVVFFGRIDGDVIAVGCYEAADSSVAEPTPPTDVNSRYAHSISYVFVKPVHQGHGHGQKLIQAMESDMEARLTGRPYRLHASRKAVSFFEKLGYVLVGSPVHPVCPGSPTFSVLFPMEKIRQR